MAKKERRSNTSVSVFICWSGDRSYELAKAVTALTLDKEYRQDEALDWGFLTRHETSHRARNE